MTADRHLPNEELNRAILADGIARLEKQLDAAEKRARDAEASAKEAKSALAEVLLDKARNQKIPSGTATHDAAPDAGEVQSLRAELDAAQRDLQQQESKLQDAREDAAEALRLEYERRFHAARERMANEFQKRLGDAEAALALNAKRQVAKEPADTPREAAVSAEPEAPDDNPAAKPAATLFGLFAFSGLDRLRRHTLAIPLAAFAGGLLLGWSALPGRSESEAVAARDTAAAAASVTPAQTALPAETAKPAPTTDPVRTAEPVRPPALAPAVVDTPPPAPEPSMPPAQTSEAATPAVPQAAALAPADDLHALQERITALSAEIDTLRRQLDAASKNVKSSEAALGTERKKSAELARRAAAAERGRDERARANEAAAATRPQRPEPAVSAPEESVKSLRYPYRIE